MRDDRFAAVADVFDNFHALNRRLKNLLKRPQIFRAVTFDGHRVFKINVFGEHFKRQILFADCLDITLNYFNIFFVHLVKLIRLINIDLRFLF